MAGKTNTPRSILVVRYGDSLVEFDIDCLITYVRLSKMNIMNRDIAPSV